MHCETPFVPPPSSAVDAIFSDGHLGRLSWPPWTVRCSRIQWISQVNKVTLKLYFSTRVCEVICVTAPL